MCTCIGMEIERGRVKGEGKREGKQAPRLAWG